MPWLQVSELILKDVLFPTLNYLPAIRSVYPLNYKKLILLAELKFEVFLKTRLVINKTDIITLCLDKPKSQQS